jgi:hypothetical protein
MKKNRIRYGKIPDTPHWAEVPRPGLGYVRIARSANH